MSPVRPLQRYHEFMKAYNLLDIYVVGKITGSGGLTV